MSFGVGLRNGIALGLGSVISFFSGYGRDQEFNNLATESLNNLVQEDGSFILV
mgnify:CR=1